MENEERLRLLALYRAGAGAVREAVASLSMTDLDQHAGQEWTAREVIHHIADAELIEAERLRRILAEDGAHLAGRTKLSTPAGCTTIDQLKPRSCSSSRW